MCEAAAGEVPGLDPDVLFKTVARNRDWFWSDPKRHRIGRADLTVTSRRIIHESLIELEFDLPDLAHEVAESYRDIRREAVQLFPQAIEFLERIRRLGFRLSLVTNGSGPTQRAKIVRFDLTRHFDHILIEGEFGVGKPDSRVYLEAMKALGSQPHETWCVGDNLEWEVAAPQRLGIWGVWVDVQGTGLPAETDVVPARIIRSLSELP